MDKYAEKRRLMIQGNHSSSISPPISNDLLRSLLRAIKIKSSKTELLHLSIATLLVTAVGLSFNSYRHVSWQFLALFMNSLTSF